MPIVWQGSSALEEAPDSPEWSFSATSASCSRRFRGPYATVLAARPWAGSIWVGGDTNGLVVQQVDVKREKPGIGLMTLRLAGSLLGGDGEAPTEQVLPADQCFYDLEKIEQPIEFNPTFELAVTDDELTAVKGYVGAGNDQDRTAYLARFSSNYWADLLASKLLRGNTHYAMFYPVYKWVRCSWFEPSVNAGGFIEAPWGPLRAHTGLEWLRIGDQLNYNGSYYQLTRGWLGAPEWDRDLYAVG